MTSMTTLILLIMVGLIILIFLLSVAGIYNSLVRIRNNIKKSWSNIDVLLKQRSDELPNLIATVKGYMNYEKATLECITDARAATMKAQSISQKAQADNKVHRALTSLFAVAENYPELKANKSYLELQQRITQIEDHIADRREFYNDSVNTWNTKIQSFPDLIVANMMKATQEELFKASDEEKKLVVVNVAND